MRIRCLLAATGLVAWGTPSPLPAQTPTATYWVYVAAESADLLHLVRFGPEGATVAKTLRVGEMEMENEGPHGLRMSGDGQFLYMTTGHGVPDGKLWKIAAGVDSVVQEPILLGRFPATLDVTRDGLYGFVANFNLHGEHEPSSVSAVYLPDLMEVAQIPTCVMPHGARLHPNGTALFSACMMDDQVVEIDTENFAVARRFAVAEGREGPLTDYDVEAATARARARRGPPRPMPRSCSPTWAQPSPDGDRLYVACNGASRVLDIGYATWTLDRTIPTGRGPYNLAVSPDGQTLVATLKPSHQVEFIDLASGTRRGIAPSSTTIPHGVVISPDSRYAFVSVEGVGAEPGKVDIFDLTTATRVADVAVGQQAGGIAFWRMESARP